MKSFFIVFIILFSHIELNAQTGIGTTTPDPSAKLEVNATNKGFLPPRVTLTSVTDATTIPNPATGLLVYNTGTNINLAAGYYYWNGASWATIATASSPNQTVDFVSVTRTTVQTVNSGDNIIFNQTNGGNIPYNSSTGAFTLTAGKTYRMTGYVALSSSNSTSEEVNAVWKTGTGDILSNKGDILSTNMGTTAAAAGVADVIYTPTANTTVSLYVPYSSGNSIIWGNMTYAIIQQIGSSAIINPWVLSGNDVYNTSGNVGIGTNAPTTKLDVTGDVKISGASTTNYLTIGTGTGDEGGEFSLARAQTNQSLGGNVNIDVYRNNIRIFEGGGSNRGVSLDLSKAPNAVGGELIWKVSGLVNAGTFLSMDNLKVSVTTGGSRGLSVATVSGSFICEIAGTYGAAGGASGSSASNITYSTTPSGSPFGWNFATMGDTITYLIYDRTNTRVYRVTLIIGASYNNNFICIERLF